MPATSGAASPPELLHVIADPTRWRLLQELAASDLRVHELTDRLGKPQNVVSYHLRELRNAGLASSRQSSADGRDSYYRVHLDRCGRLLCAVGASLQPGLQLRVVSPDRYPPVARRARVLFLCTGNSARSQMAEALVTAMSAGAVEARSAGSDPKPLHPTAVRVMAERHIDISGRPAKHLRRFARTRFDHVISLCDRVREVCPEFPRHPVVSHWSIPDPATEADDDAGYPAFRAVADDLEIRIRFLIAELTAPPDERRSHGE